MHDNMPVHTALEMVFMEEEFAGTQLLWLVPYSAPMNPIEIIWSAVKAKCELAAALDQALNAELGLTQAEH